jgi:type I restriction enzyme S subunit
MHSIRLSGWRPALLEDLIVLQRGFDITKEQQKHGNIPVISSSGVTSFHSEAKVDGPGVVIGRKGSLGTVHYVDGPYWPHDTTLWGKDFKGNNPRFVFYFLQTLHLDRYDVGNSNPTLNRNHIHRLKIFLPEKRLQTKIVEVLSAYDDMIENNRRRIQLLEESARLLYKEWFVRLRFPGHEHVKVVDGVPEGWERTVLGNVCNEVRELVSPNHFEPNTPYIGLEHMPRRSITLYDWGQADQVSSSKLRFREGEILFGKIRPYFHKVGIALTDGIASSDAIVIRPVSSNLLDLVLLTMSSDSFVAVTAQKMKEGSKMPRADWKQMKEYLVLLPSDGVLRIFNDTIDPILAQLKTFTFMNRRLSKARDLLLPRLMNGEIAV